jgi:hypothetical protein
MLSKLKTLFWFIKNPRYLSNIKQLAARRKNQTLEDTRDESTKWCESVCVTQAQAIEIITGSSEILPVESTFPDVFAAAKQRADACPHPMGGEGASSFLYTLTKRSDAKRILETGVAYGWSSLAFLLALEERQGQLISNDMPYVKMGNEDYVGCVVPENLRKFWDLQRLPDVKGIPMAIKKFSNSIDIIHYDSDKSYTGRQWSSPLLWEALAPNGILISDDINDNLGFKHFCDENNLKPVIFKHLEKYVGILTKS